MAEGELCVAVVALDGSSESILVLLAGALDERHKGEQAEESEVFSLVAPDRVHALKGERFAVALIAHVEGVNEAEISKGHAI